MATDYETLIPGGIAEQAIAAAEQESVVLALGNVIRMGAGVESIPVVSVAPSVGFVSPAYGGPSRSPRSSGAPSGSSPSRSPPRLRSRMRSSTTRVSRCGRPFARRLRSRCEGARPGRSVRNERPTRVPGRWDRRTRRSRPELGPPPRRQSTRHSRRSRRGRAADRHRLGACNSRGASPVADGVRARPGERRGRVDPLRPSGRTTVHWDPTKGEALVGDWTQILVGVREDITYELSTDGVLVDPGRRDSGVGVPGRHDPASRPPASRGGHRPAHRTGRHSRRGI